MSASLLLHVYLSVYLLVHYVLVSQLVRTCVHVRLLTATCVLISLLDRVYLSAYLLVCVYLSACWYMCTHELVGTCVPHCILAGTCVSVTLLEHVYLSAFLLVHVCTCQLACWCMCMHTCQLTCWYSKALDEGPPFMFPRKWTPELWPFLVLDRFLKHSPSFFSYEWTSYCGQSFIWDHLCFGCSGGLKRYITLSMLQNTLAGRRCHGGQRKCWMDSIKEWASLPMPELLTRISWLVNWCSDPSQPLGNISGLKETFIKRYTVERANRAEIRQQEQSQNGELSGEMMEWNTVERAIKTAIDIRTEIKRSGRARLVYVRHKPLHPHHVKASPRGRARGERSAWYEWNWRSVGDEWNWRSALDGWTERTAWDEWNGRNAEDESTKAVMSQ